MTQIALVLALAGLVFLLLTAAAVLVVVRADGYGPRVHPPGHARDAFDPGVWR